MQLPNCVLFSLVLFAATGSIMAEELQFIGQYRQEQATSAGPVTETRAKRMTWESNKTALIICDVWDYHHCLNAVRRLEEFAPRMNELVKFARSKGVTIIHAPSDCMPAYEKHPARQRAVNTPVAAKQPEKIKTWCSRIPAEEKASYPIDQSDGGEDDDPVEHAAWAEKLAKLGRNPKMPWKAQSALIEIDAEKDYISDRGDEVWNILEARKIDQVMLVGVHVNMCVIGRPFGLRQMVQNGKDTILVRDLTDAMYNPARWPFVNHLTGTDLVIEHIEKYVCSTTTSDQFLGGKPFKYQNDQRNPAAAKTPAQGFQAKLLPTTWQAVQVPNQWSKLTAEPVPVAWYRANVRLNQSFASSPLELKLDVPAKAASVWLNGEPLSRAAGASSAFTIPAKIINLDDANLLVIRLAEKEFLSPPTLVGKTQFAMKGRWEVRVGDDPTWSNIPLPAKFGASTDIYFEP